MSIAFALALAAQLFAQQAGQDPLAPAPPPPQQFPSTSNAFGAAQGTPAAAQRVQEEVLLQQAQEAQAYAEQHRALAERYAAGASHGAFAQAQGELYAASIALQDSEADLHRAIEEARRHVERLQRDLEQRQAAKRPAEVLLRGEQIQLDHLDPRQLQELHRRIGAALERQAEGEPTQAFTHRWKVETEAAAPEQRTRVLRYQTTPAEPGAAPRIFYPRTGHAPLEVEIDGERVQVYGLGGRAGAGSDPLAAQGEGEFETIIVDEQNPFLSTRPRSARSIVRGETRLLTPEAPRARVSSEPGAKAVEILRLNEEKDGATQPARIVVRRDGAEEQEVEVEGLPFLGRFLEARQARPAQPAPPSSFDPRTQAPAPDSQEALLEVTSLVREMVREVRELRSSLEELRAQVHGSDPR